MNPSNQYKPNNLNSCNQTKNNLNKYKSDLIKENHNLNYQKNFICSNNFEKENNSSNKKIYKTPSNINKTNCPTNDNNTLDKKINLSNTQDLTRHFSGNGIKKKVISNISILSPKTQKDILNIKGKNTNLNENLYKKNINLSINPQNLESTRNIIIKF